jgi:hypothetical protein
MSISGDGGDGRPERDSLPTRLGWEFLCGRCAHRPRPASGSALRPVLRRAPIRYLGQRALSAGGRLLLPVLGIRLGVQRDHVAAQGIAEDLRAIDPKYLDPPLNFGPALRRRPDPAVRGRRLGCPTRERAPAHPPRCCRPAHRWQGPARRNPSSPADPRSCSACTCRCCRRSPWNRPRPWRTRWRALGTRVCWRGRVVAGSAPTGRKLRLSVGANDSSVRTLKHLQRGEIRKSGDLEIQIISHPLQLVDADAKNSNCSTDRD